MTNNQTRNFKHKLLSFRSATSLITATITDLQARYPLPIQPTVIPVDDEYLIAPNTSWAGGVTGETRFYSKKVTIRLAAKNQHPLLLISTLAHEYKHCMQRYLEDRNMHIPKDEYMGHPLELEASLFGKQEAYRWRDQHAKKINN